MEGQTVIAHSLALGPFIGVLREHEDEGVGGVNSVKLENVRQLCSWSTKRGHNAFCNVASIGVLPEETVVSAEAGEVYLHDVNMVMPVSLRAQKTLRKAASE